MTPKAAAAQQRDEQVDGTFEQALRSAVDGALKDVHTCLPGIVTAFDANTQTAQVRPAIKRIFVEEGAVNLPLCVDVPVQFPAGGNVVFTFPVAAGDECLLVFSERAIDYWWEKGGVQLPAEYRLHDLSDAFAIVGVSSKARKLSPPASTSVAEIRTRDGSTTPSEIARKGDTVTTTTTGVEIVALAAALLATGAFVPSGSPPAPPPEPFPQFASGEITSGSTIVKAG